MKLAYLSASTWVTTERLESWLPAFVEHAQHIVEVWAPLLPELSTKPSARIVSQPSELRGDEAPILFVASLPSEMQGFLAYHWEQQTRPYGVVLADGPPPQRVIDVRGRVAGLTVRSPTPEQIARFTTSATHELEMLIDPLCDRTFGDTDAEISDPVQENTIKRGAVVCSAFVTGAWFNLTSGPTVMSDQAIELAPGDVAPGGYKRLRDGSTVPAGYRPLTHKDHHFSRAARRKRTRERRHS